MVLREADDRLLGDDEEKRFVETDIAQAKATPSVRMWCSRAQRLPTRITRRASPVLKCTAAVVVICLWLMACISVNNRSAFAEPKVNGMPVTILSCGETSGVWERPNQKCGINGQNCWGSGSSGQFSFRCPANCIHDGRTFQKESIGTHIAERELLVIGSDNLYRADSTLCAAAIHHGAISNSHGGCATINLKGQQSGFKSAFKNGVQSIAFDGSFLGSFEFVDSGRCSGCTDRRITIGLISFIALLFIGYFFTSPGLFLFTTGSIGFWTLYFGVDSPVKAGTQDLNAQLISMGFQRYLPMLMGLFLVYHVATRPQLHNMPANLSRAIFWCIPFYFGVLENYTFALLPIDRMLISDFNSQRGGWLTVIVLSGLVLAAGVSQAVQIWRTGRFKKVALVYGGIVTAAVLLSCIPNETLRLHHYIIGLILVPGTYLQTTPSLMYQGLCVGLFVSGTARWGFASILETSVQVQRNINDDPTRAFFLPASISMSSFSGGMGDIILKWDSEPSKPSQTYSLMINDLECWRGEKKSFNLTEWIHTHVTPPAPRHVYPRVAPVDAGVVGRYTLAGVVDIYEGSWLEPPEGLL